MSETINFDELADIRQANIRGAQYHLRRFGDGVFNISNEGKAVIGHNPNKGVNVKYGNGVVVIATLPKEDKKCTSGLLNGTVGNRFTSSELEGAIVENGIESEKYDFEFLQEYQGLKYYKLVAKSTEDSSEDENASDDSVSDVTDEDQDQSNDAEEETRTPEAAPTSDEF